MDNKQLIDEGSEVNFDNESHTLFVNGEPFNYLRFDRISIMKDGFSIAQGAYHPIVGLTEDNKIKVRITAKKIIFKSFNATGASLLHVVLPQIKKKSLIPFQKESQPQPTSQWNRKHNSISINQFPDEFGGYGFHFGHQIKRSINGNFFYITNSGNRRYITDRVYSNNSRSSINYISGITNRLKFYEI